MRRWLRGIGVAVLVTVAAACGEDGPSGPGTLNVEVSWDVPLGAVSVEMAGTGLSGARAVGDGWIASDLRTGALTVVAVSRQGGSILFQVEVEDLGAPLPAATVLRVSTADGRVLPSANGVTVDITR